MELIHPGNGPLGIGLSTVPVPPIHPENGPLGIGLSTVPVPIHPENGPLGTGQVPIQDVDQSDIEDIYRLPPHVTTGFAETFKESKDIMGFSFMEKVNRAIYTYSHFAMYATLNLLLSPFISFWLGFSFAAMHFAVVWFVQPFTKCFYIVLRAFNLVYEPILRCCCDPFHRSVALILSGIKGQFKINSSDVKTTQV